MSQRYWDLLFTLAAVGAAASVVVAVTIVIVLVARWIDR